jgi:hypothetical protein
MIAMNKQTLNIASVCIVALILVFSTTQKKQKNNTNNANNISISNGVNKIETKADQYKADIINTVSDANIKNFQDFTKSFKKTGNDNLTDSLSKDVFSQYIKYNTSGTMSDDDILEVTNNVLSQSTNISDPITYTDIQITTPNISNLKIYGNNIAVIQNSINKGILSIEDKSSKIPYLASIYSASAKLFIEIDVPESLSENHINIINGYKKYSEGLLMMEKQEQDPATALLGLNKVKTATDEILSNFENIKKAIILNKVDYTENEPGFIWISNNPDNTAIKLE